MKFLDRFIYLKVLDLGDSLRSVSLLLNLKIDIDI